jgi:hypothetical protein
MTTFTVSDTNKDGSSFGSLTNFLKLISAKRRQQESNLRTPKGPD